MIVQSFDKLRSLYSIQIRILAKIFVSGNTAKAMLYWLLVEGVNSAYIVLELIFFD